MPTSVAPQRRPGGGTLHPAAASSLAPDWLHAAPAPARVVGIFDRAAYLFRDGDADVLPVLAPGALALPGGLRVADVASLHSLALDLGQEVQAGHGRVVTPGGGLVVRRTWAPPQVPSGTLSPAARERALEATEPFLDPVDDLGAEAALAHDPSSAVADLVGLGPGLTPAGDDVLCGLLLGLRATGRERDRASLERLVLPQLHRTTALSGTLLRQAARGYAVPPVATLLRAWHREEQPAALRALAAEVAGVGHTSGRALLLGLATSLTSPHTPTEPVAAAAGTTRGPS